MKTTLITISFLLLHITVNSQTWKVFGNDTINNECRTYSSITVLKDVVWNGLNKLDGSTITEVETPSMLFVCDLSKSDPKGNLWFIGSIKPDIWTTHGNSFTVYKFNGSDWFDCSPPKSFGYNLCKSIAFTTDGKVWFSTSDSGAYMYDGAEWNHYIKYSVFKGANSIAIDKNGNKWFGTDNGLIKFDGTNWTVFNSGNSGLKTNKIYGLAVDNNDNIWIGAGLSNSPSDTLKGAIIKYDGVNWVYHRPFINNPNITYISTIAKDPVGKIWAGTFSGLCVFEGSKWKNFNVPHNTSDNLEILSIDFDSIGNIWLGTTCGIFKFKDNPLSLKYSSDGNKLNVFPNPANTYLNIKFPGQIKKGELYILDVSGKLVLKTTYCIDNLQLNISSLKNGAYFIHCITTSYTTTGKFIKEQPR